MGKNMDANASSSSNTNRTNHPDLIQSCSGLNQAVGNLVYNSKTNKETDTDDNTANKEKNTSVIAKRISIFHSAETNSKTDDCKNNMSNDEKTQNIVDLTQS